jgi:hypothetical protein
LSFQYNIVYIYIAAEKNEREAIKEAQLQQQQADAAKMEEEKKHEEHLVMLAFKEASEKALSENIDTDKTEELEAAHKKAIEDEDRANEAKIESKRIADREKAEGKFNFVTNFSCSYFLITNFFFNYIAQEANDLRLAAIAVAKKENEEAKLAQDEVLSL